MNSNHNLSKLPTVAEMAKLISDFVADTTNRAKSVSETLVACLDAKPTFATELIETGVDAGLIWRLERFGRGQIHKQLLLSTTPGAMKLMTLTLSEQTRVFAEGVEVMDDDEKTTRIIPFNDLSRQQCKQIFAQGTVRNLTQQRTWIRDDKRKRIPETPEEGYRVFKDHVVITRSGKWPKATVIQWLAEMK